MDETSIPPRTGKAMLWTGRVLSAIPILLFCFGAVFSLLKPEQMQENLGKMGYDMQTMHWVIVIELVCAVLYAIPQTAVLGAILLTGYLGGAVATHLRIHDPMGIAPFIFGIVVWLGVFLRDARVRAIAPFRR